MERKRTADKTESKFDNDESVLTKMGREVYVFGAGTAGGAAREAADAVTQHPKDTAIKLAESVGVGALLAGSQLGPVSVKFLGRVAAAGLGISFFADAFSPSRWQKLGEAARDTWRSGANTDRNLKIVQGSLGHLAFDSAFMLGGAKLGMGFVRKGIEYKFGAPRSETVVLKDLPKAAAESISAGKVSTRQEAAVAQRPESALAGQAELERPDLLSTNPAGQFNQAYYKFVPAKIAAVDARTYNGNAIGFSADGQNKLIGDRQGNLRHMQSRKDATPEEVAHLVTTGGFTNLIKSDPLAWDAARSAAISSSGLFSKKSVFQEAALGSQDYISGKPGNAYTSYLRGRFGDWTSKDSAWASHIMGDMRSPHSPWNPSYVPATESLFANGLPITEANRAAATNPHVMSLPVWERKGTIEAVSRLAQEYARQQYPGADPMVHDAAVGKIASELGAFEVEAARAIWAESRGADLNAATVHAVVRLVGSGVVPDAAQSYRAWKVALTTPAAKVDKVAVPKHVEIQFQPEGAGAGNATPAQSVDVRITGSEPAPSIQSRVDAIAAAVERLSSGKHPADISVEQMLDPKTASQAKAAAEHLLVDMHSAGFSVEQMLNPNTISVAKAILYESPRNLATAAETARIVPPQDFSVSSVRTVQAMVDAGWDPRRIQRADVWTAEAILHNYGYPTPAEVRKLRLDERFIPRPGAKLPTSIVSHEP